MIFKSSSESSLNTTFASRSNVSEAENELETLFSDKTLDAAATPIFRNPISSYTKLRDLAVVTGILKSELLLYQSIEDAKTGRPPIFSTSSNKLHFLKKNAPILTILAHEDGARREYCKIYFKVLHNNLTCYVLMFSSGENVTLFNNALKPHCDTLYKGTKIRIFGAPGASSTFGNAAMKMYLLHNSCATLVDGMDVVNLDSMKSIKELDISSDQKSSELYHAVVSQKRNEVSRLLSSAVPIAPIPFATFTENGARKVDNFKVQGIISLFETNSMDVNAPMSCDSLVLVTIMLTLIEQELSKMRGNNKPTYKYSNI